MHQRNNIFKFLLLLLLFVCLLGIKSKIVISIWKKEEDELLIVIECQDYENKYMDFLIDQNWILDTHTHTHTHEDSWLQRAIVYLILKFNYWLLIDKFNDYYDN